MPFLRAALLKKNLEKIPEPEQPPVVIEEVFPTEEILSDEPENIEALQQILDERAEEAEIEIAPQPIVVLEVETVVEEAEDEEEVITLEEAKEIENDADEIEVLDEAVPVPEDDGGGLDVLEIQEEESPEQEAGSEGIVEEVSEEVEPEEVEEQEPEPEPEPIVEDEQVFDENSLLEETPEPEPEPEPTSHKDYSGSHLDYDFTSGERYVDKVSTKTEFDKVLDELSAISKDLLAWQTEKFARQYTEKFQDGEESSVADARKCEAFLGGYITNAAMQLYDMGYRDVAIKQLEQAISILQARMKLEDETSAIKSRVEEQNDTVDLSDILGLFGDG